MINWLDKFDYFLNSLYWVVAFIKKWVSMEVQSILEFSVFDYWIIVMSRNILSIVGDAEGEWLINQFNIKKGVFERRKTWIEWIRSFNSKRKGYFWSGRDKSIWG